MIDEPTTTERVPATPVSVRVRQDDAVVRQHDGSVRVTMLLCRSEVACALGLDESSVSNLHRLRRLTGRLVGKSLRWRPVDLHKFVEGLDLEGKR